MLYQIIIRSYDFCSLNSRALKFLEKVKILHIYYYKFIKIYYHTIYTLSHENLVLMTI